MQCCNDPNVHGGHFNYCPRKDWQPPTPNQSASDGGLSTLRLEQAGRVLPEIGPLLDIWDGMPLDLQQEIVRLSPELAGAITRINAEMEGR